ncbi:hypothetical protein QS257_17445 [Terrilactibacillus sp. S3-3]|nr:hypothetical protein QS257_17445 [Terrilactibacillus sp. S3-3]
MERSGLENGAFRLENGAFRSENGAFRLELLEPVPVCQPAAF